MEVFGFQRYRVMAEQTRCASWVQRPVRTALVQDHAFQIAFLKKILIPVTYT